MKKEFTKFLSLLLCVLSLDANISLASFAQTKGRGITTYKECQVGADPVNPHRQLAPDEEFIEMTTGLVITYDSGSNFNHKPGAKPVTCYLPAGKTRIAVKKDTGIAVWDEVSGNDIFEPKKWIPVPRPQQQAEKTPPPPPAPPQDRDVNVNVTGIPPDVNLHVSGAVDVNVKHSGTVGLEPTKPLTRDLQGGGDKKSWCGTLCKIGFTLLGIGVTTAAVLASRGRGKDTTIIERGFQPLPPPPVRPAQ